MGILCGPKQKRRPQHHGRKVGSFYLNFHLVLVVCASPPRRFGFNEKFGPDAQSPVDHGPTEGRVQFIGFFVNSTHLVLKRESRAEMKRLSNFIIEIPYL